MGDTGVLDRPVAASMTRRRSRAPELAALLAVVLVANGLLWLSKGPSGPPGGPEAALWQRHSTPVLTASEAWEGRAVMEPSVWLAAGRWHMIYSAGWNSGALGYATAPAPAGPWTKHGRILGEGYGGWAGSALHSSVYRERGRIWVYFSAGLKAETGARDLLVATGPDPMHLRTLPEPAIRADGRARALVNGSIVKDGGRYRMLVESMVRDKHILWQTGYAEGDSPEHLTIRQFPLPSLARGDHGMFGGVNIVRDGDGWAVWFHSSLDGHLPTDIYRATSDDLVSWRATRTPVLARQAPWEHDQVADPFLVGNGGRTFLFYSGMNNPKARGAIGYASTPGTVAELLDDSRSWVEWLPFR